MKSTRLPCRRPGMEKLMAPHYESTRNRAAQEKVVLAVQDTTFLNYNAHPATENPWPAAGQACRQRYTRFGLICNVLANISQRSNLFKTNGLLRLRSTESRKAGQKAPRNDSPSHPKRVYLTSSLATPLFQNFYPPPHARAPAPPRRADKSNR